MSNPTLTREEIEKALGKLLVGRTVRVKDKLKIESRFEYTEGFDVRKYLEGHSLSIPVMMDFELVIDEDGSLRYQITCTGVE